jgi:5-phospho-D-xylono-1,4-lactonase
MKIIRTILGDIDPDKLGRFNYHEHAFQISPLLLGDELEDEEKAKEEFLDLKESGFDGYLEATPFGLGRAPLKVAQLAKDTKLHIIHTTGFHKPEHYQNQAEILNFSASKMSEIIQSEIEIGFLNTTYKAGVVKAGIGAGALSDFEISALKAAAEANIKLDVPIMVHLDAVSDPIKVLDFFEENHVNLNRVLLAHIDTQNKVDLLAMLAERGAFLGFDRAARVVGAAQTENLTLFSELVKQGFSNKILFGGDLARRSRYLSYGGSPGLRFLGEVYLPKLITISSQEVVTQILQKNPVTWLSFTG